MKIANPKELGFDTNRLQRVSAAIKDDVSRQTYDGAVFIVARRGRVVAHEAIGFANRASARPARHDDVFAIFSVTKTMTTASVLARVERGEILLTTKVADIIPEFGAKGKHRVTIANLLTHMGGMSAGIPPVPPQVLGNLETFVAAVCQMGLEAVPGTTLSYSPITAHAVLGEVVRRLDGGKRRFRDILSDEFFKPLGMNHTSLGKRADLASRMVPVVVRDRRPGLFQAETLEAFNELLTEEAEIPAGGAISTAEDIFRWAEMLRRGGELDGARVLSPAILALATTNHTGTRPNNLWNYALETRGWEQFPAYLGLSFFLRGEGIIPTPFGTMASARTFGGLGAGSAMFMVDPERDLTFVFLSAGLMEESYNVDRLQKLSDLVIATIVD